MIGRNGVGKTTALKAMMGLAQVTRGRIVFDGEDVTGLAPHAARASAGSATCRRRATSFRR